VNHAGDVLMEANQYQAALDRYTNATQLAPDGALYWFNQARAQLALHQSSIARQSFEKAAHLQSDWLPPISGLVLLDLEARDYQSARNRVGRLLTSYPGDANVLALQGDVEWAAGDLKAAGASYLQAQQHHASAGLAMKQFRLRVVAHEPNPEQPLLQWLTLQPNDRTVHSALGTYYLAQHGLQQARQEFEAVLQLAPSDVVALNDLAWIYGEVHDARAEALAEHAYQLAPDQPNVDDTFGWILAREGKVERALPLLQQAAKLDAGDPNVQYHYAYALAHQGRRAEAQQVLSNLLATQHEFDSRRDAERLLADTRT
jgi:cellulose synthase operon protein C